jgi:hypothetical protein
MAYALSRDAMKRLLTAVVAALCGTLFALTLNDHLLALPLQIILTISLFWIGYRSVRRVIGGR